MTGQPRTPGRHRADLPHSRLSPSVGRPGPRRGEQLAAAWPGWSVLYGLGSCHFYAIAAWPTSWKGRSSYESTASSPRCSGPPGWHITYDPLGLGRSARSSTC